MLQNPSYSVLAVVMVMFSPFLSPSLPKPNLSTINSFRARNCSS